jgi:hypothetical protein
MIKAAAIHFGIVFLLIGTFGFVPAVTPSNGMLLGIFHVNTTHNIVHFASGVVFLLCGMAVGLAVVMLFLGFGASVSRAPV